VITARRVSVLEVRLGAAGATTVQAEARDEVGSETLAELHAKLAVSADSTLEGVDGLPDLAPLIGESATSGFRRRLAELARDTARLRLAHRVLDDLPILLRVAFQTTILDHPALPRPAEAMSLAGADQCEGWRSDGTMLQQIAREGTLQMALTEPVQDSTGPWSAEQRSLLPAMATRRRRRVEVSPGGDGLDVTAHFRDSYADPDGVERGLHGYSLTARITGDGTIAGVDASGVVLPWPECWRATSSTERLTGLHLRDLDQFAKTQLVGRGTCTHLNDTLRALADVAELGDAAAVG
jgi:hypothetical protein